MGKRNEKTSENKIRELMAEHFPPEVFDKLDKGLQERIRRAMVSALWAGVTTFGRHVLAEPETPIDPLVRAIAEDAAAFEAMLVENGVKAAVNRERCSLYPWGWRYTDPRIQDHFRRFCHTRATRSSVQK